MPGGDPHKLVASGERLVLPAARHNRWQGAADYVESQRRLAPGQGGGGEPEGLIHVRNDSGGDVGRFNVLGIAGVLIAPPDSLPEFTERYALSGVTPTLASHSNKFVITYEPIVSGTIGRAWVTGRCPARINAADIGATSLNVADGDSSRLTAGSGVQVLYSAAGGTAVGDSPGWAIVRFGGGGSALPPPGKAYQVLQLDENGNPIWDWMQVG